LVTEVDYTTRLESNVKKLQDMALEISKQGREDEKERPQWIKQNKEMFMSPARESRIKDSQRESSLVKTPFESSNNRSFNQNSANQKDS